MKLVSVEQRLKEIQNIMSKAIFTEKDSADIVNIRITDCPKWQDYIYREPIEGEEVVNKSLEKGMIVEHQGVKYLVMQKIATVLESQLPNATGMLALYKPYRDSEEYEWLYGEYVEIGWVRYTVKGTEQEPIVTRYKAIQEPNANIYSPELVPAVWQVVE